eukprot:s36_g20.t1
MAEPEKLSCKSCSYLYLPEQGRTHGKLFQCTTCSSAERVLRQNLGDKHGLNGFTASEACKFYRDIHQRKKASQNGRLSWNTLRAGWKEETVLAQENFYSNELKCQVYKVPIKATTWSEEHTRIHTEVLKHEQEAAKRKQSKKQKKGTQAEEKSSDGEMDLPSAGSKDKTGIGAFAKQFDGFAERNKLEKAGKELNEGTKASVEKCITTLRAYAEASRSCVNAQEATREMEELQALPALPYDTADLKAVQQQAHVLQQGLRNQVPKKPQHRMVSRSLLPSGAAPSPLGSELLKAGK